MVALDGKVLSIFLVFKKLISSDGVTAIAVMVTVAVQCKAQWALCQLMVWLQLL
jgi:hypothetical protein